jgi:hypothetical protein
MKEKEVVLKDDKSYPLPVGEPRVAVATTPIALPRNEN